MIPLMVAYTKAIAWDFPKLSHTLSFSFGPHCIAVSWHSTGKNLANCWHALDLGSIEPRTNELAPPNAMTVHRLPCWHGRATSDAGINRHGAITTRGIVISSMVLLASIINLQYISPRGLFFFSRPLDRPQPLLYTGSFTRRSATNVGRRCASS